MAIPNNENFVKLSTNSSIKDESDFNDYDSSMDHASSLSEREHPRSIDYWFGKKYFECIIAQDLLQTAQENDTIETVDSRLQDVLRKYPHGEALQMLSGKSPLLLKTTRLLDGSDPFSKLMTVIGAVVRLRSPSDRYMVLEIVRGMSAAGEPDVDDTASVTQSEGPHNGSQVTSTISNGASLAASEQTEVNLGKYTQRLKEISDREGVQLEYTTERYANDPSRFHTIVRFKGSSFDGFGRSKQEAKNRGSKEVCDYLDSQRLK